MSKKKPSRRPADHKGQRDYASALAWHLADLANASDDARLADLAAIAFALRMALLVPWFEDELEIDVDKAVSVFAKSARTFLDLVTGEEHLRQFVRPRRGRDRARAVSALAKCIDDTRRYFVQLLRVPGLVEFDGVELPPGVSLSAATADVLCAEARKLGLDTAASRRAGYLVDGIEPIVWLSRELDRQPEADRDRVVAWVLRAVGRSERDANNLARSTVPEPPSVADDE